MKKSTLYISRTIVFAAILLTAAGAVVFTPGAANQDGGPPDVSINPQSLDFGRQVVNVNSRTRRVTLTNSGGKPLYIDSVSLTGDNINSFVIGNDNCTGATVAPQRACVVDVSFSPTTNDEKNARLTFTDNAASSPQIVNLTGNGINPEDVPAFP